MYLHNETIHYNKGSNTADLVESYASDTGYENVSLVLPRESLSLEDFTISKNLSSRNQLFGDRETQIRNYRAKKNKSLLRDELLTSEYVVSNKLISKYFSNVFNVIPPLIRFFKGMYHTSILNFISGHFSLFKRRVYWDKHSYESSKVLIVFLLRFFRQFLKSRILTAWYIQAPFYLR